MKDLIMQARNQDSPRLWREPDHPIPLARRAAGRGRTERPVDDSPSRGDGLFEHCSGGMATTEALARSGCRPLGSSEIDEHALEYQGRVLWNATTGPVDFWDDPIGRFTREEKERLKVIVPGLPCTHFSLVNHRRKGAGGRSAWMAIRILKTLDDPDTNLDTIAIENVPA